MSSQGHAALAAAAVIVTWTIAATAAAVTSDTNNLPMSLPNTLTLIAVGTMLLMLAARALAARPPHSTPAEHIIPVDQPGMNTKDLAIVLLSAAAWSYAAIINVLPLSTEPGSLHWLASAYAAHASLLHIAISWFQRKNRLPRPKGATP